MMSPRFIAIVPALLAGVVGFCGSSRADGDDDTLQMYLSKSDVVLLGEFTSEPIGSTREVGVINYGADFRISQLIKGAAVGERKVGGTIPVNVVRFESAPEDHLPVLKKGGKAILFLKCNDRQAKPTYQTADVWFGVQPPSPWMAKSLARLAAEQAKPAKR